MVPLSVGIGLHSMLRGCNAALLLLCCPVAAADPLGADRCSHVHHAGGAAGAQPVGGDAAEKGEAAGDAALLLHGLLTIMLVLFCTGSPSVL